MFSRLPEVCIFDSFSMVNGKFKLGRQNKFSFSFFSKPIKKKNPAKAVSG